MCYPHPGPRCSAYAAKVLTRIHMQILELLSSEGGFPTDEATSAKIDKLMEKREEAQREFNATPAGLEILEREAQSTDDWTRRQAREKLKEATAWRKHRLALLKIEKDNKDEGSIKHRRERIDALYQRAGLRQEFQDPSVDRIGWDVSNPQFGVTGNFLIKASDAWASRITPQEFQALCWLTEGGTQTLSRTSHKPSDDHAEYMSHQKIAPEEIQRRAEDIKTAFAKAPKLPEPVVLYRGIGTDSPFDHDEVINSGEYQAPTVLSASVNPGIAHSFGYGKVMLEMKTRRFPSAINFSTLGTKREAEVMIAPGSRWKVVAVHKGVKFCWEGNKPDVYTVIQMEETDD